MKKIAECGGEYVEAKIADLVCSLEELKTILTTLVPEWAGIFIEDKNAELKTGSNEFGLSGMGGAQRTGYDLIIPGGFRGKPAKGLSKSDIAFKMTEGGKWSVVTNSKENKISPLKAVRDIGSLGMVKQHKNIIEFKKVITTANFSASGENVKAKTSMTPKQILELYNRLKKVK